MLGKLPLLMPTRGSDGNAQKTLFGLASAYALPSLPGIVPTMSEKGIALPAVLTVVPLLAKLLVQIKNPCSTHTHTPLHRRKQNSKQVVT